jgi:protein-tyrosine-phosphatase
MKILVLCTGNSARSILLESVLNSDSLGRITAYSAGSKPTGIVNPAAVTTLKAQGLPTECARSKSWDEFAGPEAPKMDVVITVCGNARDEECPYWPGAPITAHWGVDDPADTTAPPEAVSKAFEAAFAVLRYRAHALIALPFEDMGSADLQQHLSDIGDMTP